LFAFQKYEIEEAHFLGALRDYFMNFVNDGREFAVCPTDAPRHNKYMSPEFINRIGPLKWRTAVRIRTFGWWRPDPVSLSKVCGPLSATFSLLAQTSNYAIDCWQSWLSKKEHKEQVSHLCDEWNMHYYLLLAVTTLEQKFR